MARILFRHPAAQAAFASMAEGMWENKRDDNDPAERGAMEAYGSILAALDACPASTKPEAPVAVPIEDRDASWAGTILENCLDNSTHRTRAAADFHAAETEDGEAETLSEVFEEEITVEGEDPVRFFAAEHEGRLFLANRRDGSAYTHAALFDIGAGRVLSGVAATSEAEATERAAARQAEAGLFGGSLVAVVPLREVSGAQAETLGATYSTDPALFLAAHRSAFRRG